MSIVHVLLSARFDVRCLSFVHSSLILLTTTVIICQVSELSSSCPKDIFERANDCFISYSREHQNLQSSHKRLCCGVDVETLRAFCSSFNNAINCVTTLQDHCPKNDAIHRSMIKVYGVESALEDLCGDDTLIEVYAQHQSCLTHAGPAIEECLARHLGGADTTSSQLVDATQLANFCRQVNHTVQCVWSNVQPQCGHKAAELATILVKPMVRHSTKCDNKVTTKAVSKSTTVVSFQTNWS